MDRLANYAAANATFLFSDHVQDYRDSQQKMSTYIAPGEAFTVVVTCKYWQTNAPLGYLACLMFAGGDKSSSPLLEGFPIGDSVEQALRNLLDKTAMEMAALLDSPA